MEVGRTIQVDIGMEVGALEQAITVTGEAPVVDAANAGFSTNFTQTLLQNIPTARQSYFDVVTFAPAVRINQVPNDSRFIIFGSSSDQNQFQYDGVDISAVSNGGVWDFPSPDIMQEVQVKAIGASAEYHSFQGGVVNIVTKSGGNDYRGMLSTYVIPGDWVANNTPSEQFPYTVHYSQQGTFELGGPIKRDRLWFYGIFPANRAATTGVGVDPSLERAGGVSYKPFFKATARLFENGNLSVGWNNNMFCSGATASRTAPLNTQTVEHGHNPVVYSQYTQTLGNATLIEVRGGGIYIRDNFTPYSNDFETPGRTDQATGVSSVNGQNASKQFHNRTTIDAAVAHSTSGFGPGTHDFKTGVQTAFANQRTVQARIGGVSYTDLSGAPYRATYNDPQATGGRIRSWGAYIQDTWTLNDRATLNLGLRYDAIDGDVPELSSDAEIEGTDGSTFSPPVVTYPGVPDLVVQHGRTPGWLHVPARPIGTDGAQVGLRTVLRQTGDRDVLRHLAGRSGHDRARVQRHHWRLHDSGQRHRPQAQLRRRFRPGQPVHRSSVGGHRAPDRRRRRDRGVLCLQERSRVRPPAGHPRRLCAPRHRRHLRRCVADHHRAVAHQRRRLTAYTVVNRGDLDQSFKSVVVEFNKRFSDRVQANTSYTWQDSKAFGSGSVSGSTQQDFSSLSPTAGYGRDPNDTLNAFGPTATNAEHAVKLSATYLLPWDFQLGGRYSYEAGRPYGRQIIVRGMGAGQGDVTILANTRGSYALPAVNDFQIRVDKDFRFGGQRRLRLSFDVFNIFNSDTVLTLRNNSSQVTATTPWQQTLSVVRPRTVQLGFRFEF